MSEHTGKIGDRLVDVYFIIDPGRFHFLKFILEGYDNFAILSSIKGKEGIVRVKTSRESFTDVMILISSIASVIKKPSI
jgi:hypothetical protein